MITDLLPYVVATGAAASGSTTIVLTVTMPVLPGDRILVCGGGGTGIPTGVSDSRGAAHTYTQIQNNATSPAAWQFECTAVQGLRSDVPHTITVTYSGTGSAKQVVAFAGTGPMAGCIGPLGAVDTPANVTATGTSAAPSVTSGALANVAPGEMVVATLSSANAGGAPTWGPNWKPIGTAQTGAGSYCSTAVYTPLQPNIANTTGTAAVQATATLSSSVAWTMAITAIKPGPATVKALVGATVYHGAYPSTSGDIGASFRFDQITGTHAGHQARKTYFESGMHSATINTPRPIGNYSDAGIWQYLCVKPTQAIGGGVSSEKTNLLNDLILWKNYIAQTTPSNPGQGGFAVILWQEPNLNGKSGSFGDGCANKQGCGSTPYWTPPLSASNPYPTEPQAASNYHDYCQYYSPTIWQAGIPIAYDPVVSSPSTGVDWYPGRKWVNAYVFDYYYHADFAAPPGKQGKGDDASSFIAQAKAANPMLPIGYAELGTNDSHDATPADIDYPGYMPWMKNVVVAQALGYVAAGGFLAPSAWYEEAQSVGDIDPNPPVNTPQTVIDAWVYFYNQMQSAQAGPPVIVTTSPLPDAQVGQAYKGVKLVASAGTPGYTWQVTSGQLPPGLTLAADGTISGTPGQAVTRTPTFQVTDSAGATATAVLSITVDASTLAIPAQTFPTQPTGTVYAAQAVATGGKPGYSWAVTSGSLPSGLTLGTSGAIGGVPITAGTSSFTLTVTDSASATASAPFTITITTAGALTITTPTFPPAPAGQPYAVALGATGGTGTGYTWQVTAGDLPPGLTLNALGVISGVPLAASLGSAVYTFTIQVTDSGAHTASAVVSITVTVPVPAPISRGPWTFLYCNPQPDGAPQGEVVQATSRVLTLRTEVGQNHEVDLTLDGRSLAAGVIGELQTDLQVLFGGQIIACCRVVPTQDDLDAAQHITTVTALDYREVLRRRYLLSTDPPSGAGANLGWTGVEQAQIAWEMITSAQARTNGNLGIAKGTGRNTGIQRTYTATAGDYVSDDIDTLAQMTNGFEWDITPYGGSDLRLDVFYPWRGADQGVVLEYGDNRISKITRVVDPTQFGNAVYVTGNSGGGGPTPHIQDASDISGRPEGRWETVIGTNLKTQSSLDQFGAAQLAQLEVLTPAYTVTLYPGAWDGPGWLWLGDYVTIRINSGRLAVNDRLRVMEMSFDVDPNNVETLTLTIGVIPLRLRKVISQMRRSLRYLNTR